MIRYATGYWVRVIGVGAGILSISAVHQATSFSSLHWHNVYQHLYYLPIVFAGLSFGWRGGLVAGAIAGISNAPMTSRPSALRRATRSISSWMFPSSARREF
jgi:hypothetical protein